MTFRSPEELEAADTVGWIIDGLQGFAANVGSLVPGGFAAYARVLHPAQHDTEAVSWSAVAAANGSVLHAEAQFGKLVGERSYCGGVEQGVWNDPPVEGSLPPTLATTLAGVLLKHTATAVRCWFAVWDGYGCLGDVSTLPAFDLPDRRYVLLKGQVIDGARSVCESPWIQSPNLWWPEDHAWMVATEVDLNSTYVGATSDCINDILSTSELESLPVKITDGVTWESDHLNPDFVLSGTDDRRGMRASG